MEERLKALEGITYKDWNQLKLIVDTKFEKEREKSTFTATEDTFEHFKIISD